MSALAMVVTCPRCGAEVEHLNSTPGGELAVAIVRCRACAREWEVTARIVCHSMPRHLTRPSRSKVASR